MPCTVKLAGSAKRHIHPRDRAGDVYKRQLLLRRPCRPFCVSPVYPFINVNAVLFPFGPAAAGQFLPFHLPLFPLSARLCRRGLSCCRQKRPRCSALPAQGPRAPGTIDRSHTVRPFSRPADQRCFHCSSIKNNLFLQPVPRPCGTAGVLSEKNVLLFFPSFCFCPACWSSAPTWGPKISSPCGW